MSNLLGAQIFIDLEELKDKTANILNSLSQEIIRSLASWEYIIDALSIQLLLKIGIKSHFERDGIQFNWQNIYINPRIIPC